MNLGVTHIFGVRLGASRGRPNRRISVSGTSSGSGWRWTEFVLQ